MTEIVYVADPMCSWCWGFAPVARSLRERFSEAAFTMLMGGLRPGDDAQPLDARLRQLIEPHWRRVAEVSGQPFDFAFFERQDFLFDTEPACRAVVVVRRMAPEKSFAFFDALQQAFFANNVDVTDPANYVELLGRLDLDAAEFERLYKDQATRVETYRDFRAARRLGAQGFPSVALRNGEKLALLSVGYQAFDVLAPAIQQFFGAAARDS